MCVYFAHHVVCYFQFLLFVVCLQRLNVKSFVVENDNLSKSYLSK